MAAAVIASQPMPRWLPGSPSRTVRTRLSSMTPCCVHGVRSPLRGAGRPRSSLSSRKMFCRLRGSGRTSGATENDRPTACPGVGYGSVRDQHAHVVERLRNARRMLAPAGAHGRPAAVSARRYSPIRVKPSCSGAIAGAHDGWTSSVMGVATVSPSSSSLLGSAATLVRHSRGPGVGLEIEGLGACPQSGAGLEVQGPRSRRA